MQNYFVIGDIHGEIGLLNQLLSEMEKYKYDKLIFIGDYIDRGPHSKPVIDRIMELGKSAECLMGNHELMLLNAIEYMGYGSFAVELWYYNGAEATLQSFGSNSFFSFKSDIDGKYLDFFHRLKMNYQFSVGDRINFLATHAGISPVIPLADQLAISNYRELNNYILEKHIDPGDSFIWIRDDFFSADPDLFENHIVIHGHTPVNKLRRFVPLENKYIWDCIEGDLCMRRAPETGKVLSVDIDSGSTISGRLSALGIIERKDDIQVISITVSADETIVRDLSDKNFS